MDIIIGIAMAGVLAAAVLLTAQWHRSPEQCRKREERRQREASLAAGLEQAWNESARHQPD